MSAAHFQIETEGRCALLPITDLVRGAVADSGVEEGVCTVFVPHTTAGVIINENADPDVARDVLGWFSRAVPPDPRFRHAEGNSDAHIKAILAGSSVSIPIAQGELELGTWQGIYFAEFDGPRCRRFTVSCIAD
jgi:secondary thiamine-phosphate synthase enzyme